MARRASSSGAVNSTGSPFVGRSEELAHARALLCSDVPSEARVLLVQGEPGVGKTRFIAEVVGHASAHGWEVLEGACFPNDRVSPFAPIVDLIRRRLAQLQPEAREALVRPFLADLAPLLPDLAPADSGWAGHTRPDDSRRRQLFDAFARCFSGSRGPLVLVIDDLHWADAGTLDWLRFLIRTQGAQPLAVIGASRIGEVPPELQRWILELKRQAQLTEIQLQPMTEPEVAELVRMTTGSEWPVALRLAASLNELAEGVPFYVEELLASLPKSGEARAASGRLPPSLEVVVRRRLEGVSPEARTVLMAAAVAGRRFAFQLLQAVTGAEESALLRIVRVLVEAGILEEESEDTFVFRHALFREAVYQDLLVRERRALHRVIAETIHSLSTQLGQDRVDELAFHYASAGVTDRAFFFGCQAGHRALKLHTPAVATQHFSRAIEAHAELGDFPDARPDLFHALIGRGRAHETLGDLDAAHDDYEQALSLASELDVAGLLARAQLQLGAYWAARDYRRAETYLCVAVPLAQASGDLGLQVDSLNRLGNWLVNAAEPGQALPLHREALGLCERLGDGQRVAATLDLLGTAAYIAGDLPASVAYLRRAEQRFRTLDDSEGLAGALTMLVYQAGGFELCTLDATLKDVGRAREVGAEALELSRTIGWRSGEILGLIQLADLLGYQGAYADARDILARATALAADLGHRQWQVAATVLEGRLALDLAQWDRAAHAFSQAAEWADKVASHYWCATAQAGRCLALLGAGDLVATRALLESVGTSDPSHSLGDWWLEFARARVLQASKDYDRALSLLLQLQAAGGQALEAGLAIARVSLDMGQPRDAEARLLSLLRVGERRAALPLVWRCHAWLGWTYRAMDDRERAHLAFTAARRVLEELVQQLPDETERERTLTALTTLLPRGFRLGKVQRRASRLGGLSARELEIARLVANGLTNREIARELVIGERTVESHLSSVLNKLGQRSRRDVARWVQDHELKVS